MSIIKHFKALFNRILVNFSHNFYKIFCNEKFSEKVPKKIKLCKNYIEIIDQ